ncbi:hypothetical protein [Oerskovia turbata]
MGGTDATGAAESAGAAGTVGRSDAPTAASPGTEARGTDARGSDAQGNTARGPGGRPIGYWLKLVDRLIDDSFADVFGRTGLTRRHWQVLNMIRDGVGDTATIDRVLSPFAPSGDGQDGQGRHAAGVSAELGDLRARGWVEQAGAAWEVTVAGRQAYHELLDAVSASRERLAEGISGEEYDRTIATLERMARNLGWAPGA